MFIKALFLTLFLLVSETLSYLHLNYPRNIKHTKPYASNIDDSGLKDYNIFGAEFRNGSISSPNEEKILYWKGKSYVKKISDTFITEKSKDEFEKMRLTFIFDSIYVSLLGLCIVWQFGSLKDSYRY